MCGLLAAMVDSEDEGGDEPKSGGEEERAAAGEAVRRASVRGTARVADDQRPWSIHTPDRRGRGEATHVDRLLSSPRPPRGALDHIAWRLFLCFSAFSRSCFLPCLSTGVRHAVFAVLWPRLAAQPLFPHPLSAAIQAVQSAAQTEPVTMEGWMRAGGRFDAQCGGQDWLVAAQDL